MKIGNINIDSEILVIAEIGNNHEGSYSQAEEMIGLAARAGAGAVKLQTIVPEKLISPHETERVNQLKKFQLSYEEQLKLSNVATRENILFLSTPFDLESVEFLNPLVPAFKIASGDNNFFPLIEKVARTGKPIILSTGMASLDAIKTTCDYIQNIWQEKIIHSELALLHCVSKYPTPNDEANLAMINKLKDICTTVGYSDHTLGIEIAAQSVLLGARIIEKHFTLNKNHSSFRDHALSADPNDLKLLVQRVKELQLVLGNTTKSDIEDESVLKVRRSIVAAADLAAGTELSLEHLIWVRPGGGLPPGKESEILGKKLFRSIKYGERIMPLDVG